MTASPAPIPHSPTPSQSSSLSSSDLSSYGSSLIQYPPTPPPEQGSPDSPSRFNISPPLPSVDPQEIVHKPSNNSGLVTPPPSLEDREGGVSAISAKQIEATLDFLTTLFPWSALSAMSHAQGVSVSSANLGTAFDGVILDLPEKTKTLYIDGKNAQHVNLRERQVDTHFGSLHVR